MRSIISNCRNILPVISALLAVLTAASVLAARPIYRGLDDKPADPLYTPSRAVFDCQPPDSLTLTVGSTVTLADSTVGRDMLVNSYPCAPWAETGHELIYRLNVAADLQLAARLSDLDAFADLDLFLLTDCDSDSCLVGANTEFGLELTAGIYFLIVDTTAPLDTTTTRGTFTLTLETRPLGVPDAICEAGGSLPVTCDGTTISIADENLFEQPDLIREYDCGTSPKTSGELWYAVTLPGTHEVTINVINVSVDLDVNLWLFDGCGPTAACLRFVDDNLGSEGETLTWVNDLDVPVTAYLAVDAVRPPSVSAAGAYTIEFQCQSNVPVSSTSFGSLRALYR